MDKRSLRAQCLAARMRITPEAAKLASMEVAKRLVGFIDPSAEVVAGYRAVRGELDIFEALAQLSERGHQLCLPVIKAPRAPLLFRRWGIGHKLTMGQYGVEVPAASEPELVPDVVLVPMAAFDAQGYRLGYGAGFYDATIYHLRRSKPQVKIIGIAFAMQQVDSIDTEPHDEKMDAVVTEKGMIGL